MYEITAVICTYKRYEVLDKAIFSLRQQSLSPNRYRIMVIDNSPDTDYSQKIKQQYEEPPFLEYIIETTPGLSNARNVAAKMCGSEFIAYMDDDAIADPYWLENIITGFRLFGANAAVLGGLVNPIWEVKRPQWLDDSLLGYVSVVDWGGETRIAKDEEWFAGTNIAFRTKEIIKNGGFETSLGRNGSGSILLSNEELRLLDILRTQGKLAIYEPKAIVSHLVEQKRLTQSWFRKRVVWQAISNYIFDSDSRIKDAKFNWNHLIQNYFCSLPPRERTIRGLFYDSDNPKIFREQLWTIMDITTLLLEGFEAIDGE